MRKKEGKNISILYMTLNVTLYARCALHLNYTYDQFFCSHFFLFFFFRGNSFKLLNNNGMFVEGKGFFTARDAIE